MALNRRHSAKSHVFVLRGQEILVLHETHGSRWWGLPGGDAHEGEAAVEAAIRETYEETGLRITAPELLRTWRYRGASGVEHSCHTFVAVAPGGDVRLSEEHSEYVWMTAEEYSERHANEELAKFVPGYAGFFEEIQRDCAALLEWLAAPRDERGR